MVSMHILCLAILTLGAAGVKKSEVKVKDRGLMGEADLFDQKDVVRREKKGTGLDKVSVFGGLERTDIFSTHAGINCSWGADKQMLGKTLKECRDACAADDDCTCISHDATKGICSKQKNCYLESCVSSSLVDTYQLHSTFKVKATTKAAQKRLKAAAKADKATQNATQVGGVYGNESFVVQEGYERSGGRDCTAGGANDNATIISAGHYDTPKDVVQCLTDCNNDASCTCVRFERYYQQACTLLSNCPLPTFCSRSSEFDMYVVN
jgi:hypothetical protein